MKRTGVIIGMSDNVTMAHVDKVMPDLKAKMEERYPGIVFTFMGGATGCVAFVFDDGEEPNQ